MENKDVYFSIESRERAEIKIKGSRFIASVAPVTTKEEAMAFIESIRKEFFDATHNCFAYRFGADGLLFRTADDGEPSGSAGKPILFSIQKATVSDVVLVVTRYFGGTKLGVGGLARAYSDAADLVLSGCKIRHIHLTKTIKIFCVYEDISIVKRILQEYAVQYEEEYHDAVEFLAQIPGSKTQEFMNKITAATNARAGTVAL